MNKLSAFTAWLTTPNGILLIFGVGVAALFSEIDTLLPAQTAAESILIVWAIGAAYVLVDVTKKERQHHYLRFGVVNIFMAGTCGLIICCIGAGIYLGCSLIAEFIEKLW